MTPYKIAVDELKASPEWKKWMDMTTLGGGLSQVTYFQNRLLAAFEAGWNAAHSKTHRDPPQASGEVQRG